MKKICQDCQHFDTATWVCRAASKVCYRKPDDFACLLFKLLIKTCSSCQYWHQADKMSLGECRLKLSLDGFYSGTLKDDSCQEWVSR